LQSRLDCLDFENKNGNDSGNYFCPFRSGHAKEDKPQKNGAKKG